MRFRSVWVAVLAMVAMAASQAWAEPALQLDILGGTYDPVGETIIAPGDVFSLYALGNPANGQLDSSDLTGGTSYLVVSITPSSTPAGNYGYFTIDGEQIDVTAEMLYGDPGLPDHGIFDTFYFVEAFQFSNSDKAKLYNSQDNAGQGPIISGNAAENTMFFKEFEIDRTNLSDDLELHFDLFTIADDKLVKAPFSHDAATGPDDDDDDDSGGPDDDDDDDNAIPEPVGAATGALALAGVGLALRRRRA